MCWLAKLPRDIFLSHNIGDDKCPQLSAQDRFKLKQAFKLNSFKDAELETTMDDQIAAQFGYSCDLNDEDNEVNQAQCQVNDNNFHRNENTVFNFIKPVASQILTVFADKDNKQPLHIELDSGANINYCEENAVRNFGFKIKYNKQVSKLGDGKTSIESIGEINETFYRNNWKVQFQAAVCRQLSSPFIGGTLFMKANGVEQDFVNDVIKLHNKSVTVHPTNPLSLLPIAPMIQKSNKVKTNPKLLTFKQQWLLPGQEITVALPDKMNCAETVSVEPDESNNTSLWPHPEIMQVKNGNIQLINTTNNPINLGKDVKRCKIFKTANPENPDPIYYTYEKGNSNSKSKQNLGLETSHIECKEAKTLVDDAHINYASIFNKDLTNGYNNYYGTHECGLNWASAERPSASKVNVPNYDHDLKVLQQELMDDLTDQNVLLIPQEHGMDVQAVCPSFIQRKQRARHKPKNELKKEDVRLLINFGPINERIKPIPSHVPKINDVLIMLGRWKHVICLDLYNGYFQLKMKKEAIPWLGIQTPFGGLRLIARAGQGLMGMAEEFEELTSKILKQEMQAGICAKIVDDIYIGGQTQKETAINYIKILEKFKNANLKITPEKTTIFPKTVDILGWVWKQGGLLEPSPHRKLALENTKIDDIRTIKDMRSWLGLFKTLHIATPHLATDLAPFEEITAGQNSNDQFVWSYTLEQAFKKA